MIKLIVGAAAVLCLFFAMCYLGTGGDEKNMKSYRSYPDAVQEKIKENTRLSAMIPAEKPRLRTNAGNVILFTAVFTVMGLILKIRDYWTVRMYFLILGEGLNLFDLLVIDSLWWRSSPRTKFSDIPDKSLYMDMTKHVASFKRGIAVFLAVSVFVSWIEPALISLFGI